MAAITSSIERGRRRHLPIVQSNQLGNTGRALAALDLDHEMIVDAQAIRRHVLRLGDRDAPRSLDPAGTGARAQATLLRGRGFAQYRWATNFIPRRPA